MMEVNLRRPVFEKKSSGIAQGSRKHTKSHQMNVLPPISGVLSNFFSIITESVHWVDARGAMRRDKSGQQGDCA